MHINVLFIAFILASVFMLLLIILFESLIDMSAWGRPFLKQEDRDLIKTKLTRDAYYPLMVADDSTLVYIVDGYISNYVSSPILAYAINILNDKQESILERTIFRWDPLAKELDEIFKTCTENPVCIDNLKDHFKSDKVEAGSKSFS